MAVSEKRGEIMAAARLIVQARGYNALSFRDLAENVGVKSASVHYHFPTKGDLGAALARRYTEEGVAYLDGLLDEGLDQSECMRRYTDIFRSALVNANRMCLVGILAAEHDDLPEEVRTEVEAFAAANIAWLVKLLSKGKARGDTAAVAKRAQSMFAAIQGAQLVARGRADVTVFDDIIDAYREAQLLP